MREIIFRGIVNFGAKDMIGKWVEGDLVQYTCGTYIRNIDGEHKVNLETVGQYTGLKDKNGTMIFEGDVVRMWNGNKSDIKHVDGYWCVSKKNRQIHWTEWKDFEVIRTIHDEMGKEGK